MGQISVPVLNRTGYSTFWQSVWDDKYNYTRGWKEDFYIRRLLPYIFAQKASINKYLLNHRTITNNPAFDVSKYINTPLGLKTYIGYFKDLSYSVKAVKPYILRVWILKFSSWIVIYFTIYTPVKGQAKKIEEKTIHNRYKYLGLYHLHTSNLKSNLYYLDLSSSTKYTF